MEMTSMNPDSFFKLINYPKRSSGGIPQGAKVLKSVQLGSSTWLQEALQAFDRLPEPKTKTLKRTLVLTACEIALIQESLSPKK